jgi:hypothetical protein
MAICYRPNNSNIWNCTPSNSWRNWATKFTFIIISSHLLSLMIHSHVNSIHEEHFTDTDMEYRNILCQKVWNGTGGT